MLIWCNGEMVEATGALDADDRGVLLGDGLFETLAVIDGAPMRLGRHLDRMRLGGSALDLPIPLDGGQVHEAIRQLAKKNEIAEGSARITVTRGAGPRGVLPPVSPDPTIIIAVHLGTVGDVAPVRAIIAASTRRNDRSPLSRIKTTNYGDSILARREAAAAGVDDAILLNTRDTVAEATAANVFCVLDGALVTPPTTDGALPGILRDIILADGLAQERTVTRSDLEGAEEIFLTTSLNVRPVVALDGARIGDGMPGPAAQRFADLPRRAD